jgi:hypothetical protein
MANVSNTVKVSLALLALAALVVTHFSTSKVHLLRRRCPYRRCYAFLYRGGPRTVQSGQFRSRMRKSVPAEGLWRIDSPWSLC